MKLWASILKDIKLSAKNYYTYILLIFVAVFVVVAIFFVPGEFNNETSVYAYVEAKGPGSDMFLEQMRDEGMHMAQSREDILRNMEKDRSSIGLYIYQENDKMVMEFITQGYESDKLKEIMEAHMMGWAAMEAGYEPNSRVTVLESGNPSIPVNKGMLPIFLVMESAFMGLFMIAAYIYQDKEEGTIKAYAVTPATLWQYLLSKVVVFVLFGWISGLLVTVFIMGWDIQYLQFMLLLTVASIFGSVLGLVVSGLFDSFTKAMTGLFVLMFILGLSVISYYMPSFSPVYIRMLPAYPLLFAFREVLFPVGRADMVYTNILLYLAISAVLFYIAVKIHEKKLA